jgi:predicted metalloprotease with PDZ domain
MAVLCVCASALAVSARGTIRYEVSLAHPEQHLFHVTMQIADVHGEVVVQMAAWNALYQIRDFSAHVQDLEAFAGTQKLFVEKIDKQTWKIKGDGEISVRYATYWDEAGPFASQLNGEHAFINPAMILLYVPERRSEAVSLAVSNVPDGWQVAGAALMLTASVSRAEATWFQANDFDALADAPVEAGKFESFDLPGMNPPISVIVHGEGWKKKEIEEELKRICTYELKLMDGAPFEHYTFIFHIGRGAGGGGMEHANATAISVGAPEGVPGVAAHEFFHLWNVKRIRPATLYPVDYTKEQFTRALWFAEGVTSTYGSYTLVRSGLWSKEQFYLDLSEQISELESRPANRWQSAEQSSLDAWLEKYPLYNRPQDSVSYYTKGQVLGVLLDILIRDKTGNQRSLDDVLRTLNVDFAKQGKAYRDSLDVRLTAEKVAGTSFEDFFHKYVSGTEAFPYEQILASAGLELKATERKRAIFGFAAERDASGALVVRSVDSDNAGGEGTLRPDDIILTLNGGDLPRNLVRWVRGQKPGTIVKLEVRREDKTVTVQWRLGEVSDKFYVVSEDSHAGEKERRIREGLLRGVTQPVTAPK